MGASSASGRPFVTGIVLAAGGSTRLGRPKQLLPFRGTVLLQHVLEAVFASGLDEVVLVLGHGAGTVRAALALPPDRAVRVVVNADWAAGQAGSLRVGLGAAASRADAAAIVLGDQPGVEARVIDRVVAAFATATAPIVRPVYVDPAGGRAPGHPVILARRVWRDLERLTGDEGARALMAAHPDWVAEVPLEGAAPTDVDTWEDYRRIIDDPGDGR